MEQHDADRLALGGAAHVAEDGLGVGVGGGGVLPADIPVDPAVALLLRFGFQPLHDLPPAVAMADRVGAAAGEPQPGQVLRRDIGFQRLTQRLDVQPEGGGIGVDLFVAVAGAVQGDLVAGCQQGGQLTVVGQVLFLRGDKKGGRRTVFGQNVRDGGGVVGRSVVKGQAGDPAGGRGRRLHGQRVVRDAGVPAGGAGGPPVCRRAEPQQADKAQPYSFPGDHLRPLPSLPAYAASGRGSTADRVGTGPPFPRSRRLMAPDLEQQPPSIKSARPGGRAAFGTGWICGRAAGPGASVQQRAGGAVGAPGAG